MVTSVMLAAAFIMSAIRDKIVARTDIGAMVFLADNSDALHTPTTNLWF
jgi:hypothetical protein